MGIGLVFSQNAANKNGPALLNQLKSTCQLSNQQMAKLQPVVEKHAEALQANGKKLDGKELKQADDLENTQFDNALKGVLTASQYKLYKKS